MEKRNQKMAMAIGYLGFNWLTIPTWKKLCLSRPSLLVLARISQLSVWMLTLTINLNVQILINPKLLLLAAILRSHAWDLLYCKVGKYEAALRYLSTSCDKSNRSSTLSIQCLLNIILHVRVHKYHKNLVVFTSMLIL